MASRSPSEVEAADLRWLTTDDYSWLRADIPALAEFDPRSVLTGAAVLPPLRAVAHEHGPVGDLVGTFWASLFLISSRFSQVLRVTGRCGPVAPAGRLLDPTTLDGSDIFTPANETSILVSPRCTTALQRTTLLNVALEPAGIEFPPATAR